MERSAWTDERLDYLAATLNEEIRALRSDLSAWQRHIAQIGWALAAALLGAIVALIVAVQ
jgi:hypothetical protein